MWVQCTGFCEAFGSLHAFVLFEYPCILYWQSYKDVPALVDVLSGMLINSWRLGTIFPSKTAACVLTALQDNLLNQN